MSAAVKADPADTRRRARDAVWAAALFAVDPAGLGGVLLRAPAGPTRDAWGALLEEFAGPEIPRRRIPIGVGADRLAGGLDLAASLAAGRPIDSKGLITQASGGWLTLPSAERWAVDALAPLLAALAAGADLGVIALDEARAEEDGVTPAALTERLGLWVDLHGLRPEDLAEAALEDDVLAWEQLDPEAIQAARGRLRHAPCPEPVIAALTQTAAALGVASLRASVFAVRAARAAAALTAAPHSPIASEIAARLVLAPRAICAPAPAEAEPAEAAPDAETPPPPAEPRQNGDSRSDSASDSASDPPDPAEAAPSTHDLTEAALAEMVLAAAAAVLPPGLMTSPPPDRARRAAAASAGASGLRRNSLRRGRPLGARPGDPRAGGRLDLVETLRAAVPWAEIRRRAARAEGRDLPAGRVPIRRADLRIKRFAQPSETLTIFVVDASGSAAFHRLAEAKGAVELLLGQAYARRDQVAVISFRRAPAAALSAAAGPSAELLLPPTRALARAKRALAALPGGGATPLAGGLCAAADLAEQALRHGATPTVAVLTDGRANIALDGRPDRRQAVEDALFAARRLASLPLRACVIDTSPRPRQDAKNLASTMAARYEPLPYSSAAALTDAVRAARDG